MKQKLIIIGGGGHAKVIIDAVLAGDEYDIHGIIDQKLEKGTKVLGVPVLGADSILPELFGEGIKNAFIGVGSIGNCDVRRTICEKLKNIGFNLPVIIHPKAVVAKDVEIEEGTFVAASATINPGTKIGKNVIINTSSSIDHDCRIGDFVHIAPGAILCGTVSVGEGTHVGIGANIIQSVKIGKNCFIPASRMVKADWVDERKS
ncbi:MAG: acetyltransferase [Candidatus Omnitrophota bacterium]